MRVYEVGARIGGKYRVERQIGAGGMGVVVAAEHEELRAPVALKFLAPELAQRGDVVERFMREARVCARLRSDHVCRVSDVGRNDDGVPYIVMELLEGRDLASVLRAHGPMPMATAVDYIVQACDAIGEAHDAHIVHRDLKPANLFLARRRGGGALIKVLDFGVAKIHEPGQQMLTRSDLIVGSPAYMAPEQVYSAMAADVRSDVWSLGVILYEMIAGRPPFEGPAVDVMYALTEHPAPRLAGVPHEFADIVARCLARMPEHRFQSTGELVAALRRYLPPGPDARGERATMRIASAELMAPGPRPRAGWRATVAGTIGATVVCVVLGMVLSVMLARCTHARGSAASGSVSPSSFKLPV